MCWVRQTWASNCSWRPQSSHRGGLCQQKEFLGSARKDYSLEGWETMCTGSCQCNAKDPKLTLRKYLSWQLTHCHYSDVNALWCILQICDHVLTCAYDHTSEKEDEAMQLGSTTLFCPRGRIETACSSSGYLSLDWWVLGCAVNIAAELEASWQSQRKRDLGFS